MEIVRENRRVYRRAVATVRINFEFEREMMARFQKFQSGGGGTMIINIDQVSYFTRISDSPNGDNDSKGSLVIFAGSDLRYYIADSLEEISTKL